uniref:Macaca fascicularis brain cDNA clone: QflA-20782, similar to human myosin X (MYO10), mRNA, RefSeq: NM_012334.1 n=1 Tax=Macaca fascicularis TaxID=9541 RepID=I7GNF7_MACFA|nr:unnamed protein product [Macaca fascicularis]
MRGEAQLQLQPALPRGGGRRGLRSRRRRLQGLPQPQRARPLRPANEWHPDQRRLFGGGPLHERHGGAHQPQRGQHSAAHPVSAGLREPAQLLQRRVHLLHAPECRGPPLPRRRLRLRPG